MRIQPNPIQQEHINLADSLHDLVPIAEEILGLQEDKSLVIVCGSISTGGRSVEENLVVFEKSIAAMPHYGYLVFDQMPWEKKIEFFHHLFYKTNDPNVYHWDILEVFYKPIFSSKKIKTAFFLPGWKRSTGASWEHEKCKELGIEIIYLPKKWVLDFDPEKLFK